MGEEKRLPKLKPYDTCFLDWVLFANLPMFRLDGTEHMDKAYHQKWFHAKGLLFPGMIFALTPVALVGEHTERFIEEVETVYRNSNQRTDE